MKIHRQLSYGYYLGGDPREFTPDPEAATPAEIEAWKRACEAWERGDKDAPDPGWPHQVLVDSHGMGVGHKTVSYYGLGLSEVEIECEGDGCQWCEEDKP